jgi:dTDP-4-dehydrorhamnose 3,5-epimerase
MQCNISENKTRHTLRGIHFQIQPYQEGKVLSCVKGSIHDIVIDLRSDSSTYLQWISVELSEVNRLSLYIPPGCANGYLTLEDNTWILYYHSEFYTPEAERGIRYSDPFFDFNWPAPAVVISDKDRNFPEFVS